MIKKTKNNFCEWGPHGTINGKEWVICKCCGRTKRKDIPSVMPCQGSKTARKTMIMQITGQDLTSKDIEYLEKCDTMEEMSNDDEEY